MEHTFEDIQHFGTIIAGIESINLKLKDGTDLDYAGRYAQSVLRLHAQDELGAYAGNESLLDNIKKGAKNTKEWIMKLLKAIRDFFFGGNRNKIKKLAVDTEATAKLIEAENPKVIIPASIPEIVKINKEVTGSTTWGDTVLKDYNALPVEEKKEAEKKLEKVVSEQDLDELGKDVVETLRTKLNGKLDRMRSLGNTINEFGKDPTKAFGKNQEGLTIELNGLSRDAEKELVDGISDAIKNLKISNLGSTIKWFMSIADSYTKDLDAITVKAKQMAEKTDDAVALGRIKIITMAYTNLIKGYQDLVIISNLTLTKAIGKAQDKVIKAILTKAATNSRPAADKYVGISEEDSIVEFYNKHYS